MPETSPPTAGEIGRSAKPRFCPAEQTVLLPADGPPNPPFGVVGPLTVKMDQNAEPFSRARCSSGVGV